jgi:hypothetical protein
MAAVCFARLENSSPLIHFTRHQGRSAPILAETKGERDKAKKDDTDGARRMGIAKDNNAREVPFTRCVLGD